MSGSSEDELLQEASDSGSVPDLAASATESDTNDEEEVEVECDDSDESSTTFQTDKDDEKNSKELPKQTREEKIKESIVQRYHERQGKQLYIRFPHKLPTDAKEFQTKATSLSPLIVHAHKPRQKHARFCLVDFASKEDRDTAMKAIKASVKTDESLKGLVASIPLTESNDFLKELAERKLKSIQTKTTQKRLKFASKKALRDKNFTSSIVVLNLPQNTSLGEVRKLFPNAVDVQIKPGRGKAIDTSIAAITMPSTMDATMAVKQKVSISGTRLLIRYDTQYMKKQKHKSKKRKVESNEELALTTLPVPPTKKAKKEDIEDELQLDNNGKSPVLTAKHKKNVKNGKNNKVSPANNAMEKKLKGKKNDLDSPATSTHKKAKPKGVKDFPSALDTKETTGPVKTPKSVKKKTKISKK